MSNNVSLPVSPTAPAVVSTIEVSAIEGLPVAPQHVTHVALLDAKNPGDAKYFGATNPHHAQMMFEGEEILIPGNPPVVFTPKEAVSRAKGLPVNVVTNWLRRDQTELVEDFVARATIAGCTMLRVYWLNQTGAINPGETPRLDLVISQTSGPIRHTIAQLPDNVTNSLDEPFQITDIVLDPAITNIAAFQGTVSLHLAAY
jgi:hypothetical protein